MEHLTNCHGEWSTLFAILAALPLLGPWIRTKVFRPTVCDHDRAE